MATTATMLAGIDISKIDWNAFLADAPHELIASFPPEFEAAIRIKAARATKHERKQRKSLIRSGQVQLVPALDPASDSESVGNQAIAKPRNPFRRKTGRLGMPLPMTLAQHLRHSVLVMSQVLNVRLHRSPFTLVLDDLEQPATHLINGIITRALSRRVNVVFLSFDTPGTHPAVRFIPAFGLHANHTGDQLLAEVERAIGGTKDSLVIVDSLHDLFDNKGVDPCALVNLVNNTSSYIVGVHHQDFVAPITEPYAIKSLDVAKHMATAILACKSLAHVLAAKAAKQRSLPEPTHGMLEDTEGIVQSITGNDRRGTVVEAEFRRVSGRPEFENFWVRRCLTSDFEQPPAGFPFGPLKKEFVMCLDEFPLYSNQETVDKILTKHDETDMTFKLDLTMRQKEARDSVILPYFDAQSGEGGEGGRILYDMGAEDDFDEEEDEI
ncbi:Elongator subunit Iki1-domain-containing protein [Clohesyomyces aquaticus]|uniref:Elongator complex protein 5 n=1 Tax=Clohesyomyces aquaticus TaxID=1231657 RepID=A0A1Y1ZJ13_9PLEO|nr:Elongator subunit Iki1-domain-containing protein [Clohesyomyces aquaticus]